MKTFVTVIFLIIVFSATAQHNHSDGDENDKALFKHEPQHGGEIIEAGKYKLEILINPMNIEDKLTIYVLKKNYKEIPLKDATGRIILKYKDGKIDTLNLRTHLDRFTTNSIDPAKAVNIFFNININKKGISGVYYYDGIIKN